VKQRLLGSLGGPLVARLAAARGRPAEVAEQAPPAAPPERPWRLRWEAQRYRTLLELAAWSRAGSAAYAEIAAAIELRADPQRRGVAVRRIRRWLGVDERAARRIYSSALRSEAREEADARYLMDRPTVLDGAFRAPADEPDLAGPAIWLTLHLGSPNLAFVYLRRIRGLDVRIVGRPLDDANPMHADKRAFGHRKVRWLQEMTAAPFLDTSAEAMAQGRSHLLQGGALFALMDTPGDVVARSIAIELFGERVRIASGAFRLAALVGVPIRPVVAVRRGSDFDLCFGRPIDPVGGVVPSEEVARELSRLIGAYPGEWWLWPYLPGAS
jgi:hypothetical protein